MLNIGERRYVDIAGESTHELPPLLVRDAPAVKRLDKVVKLATDLIEQESLIPLHSSLEESDSLDLERRRFDLAIQLADQYLDLRAHWHWGNGILEWIRQCETTFEMSVPLRSLLRPDVWPHAGRSSFINLLEDKHLDTGSVNMTKAVGLRLAFRQLPPFSCCSDQFLFYLNNSVANSAYNTWSAMSPDPIASLPPERFSFQVVKM